jgi:hypothetical protein
MGKGSFVGYETIELNNTPKTEPIYQLHMKAKGRWQILKWDRFMGDFKYRIVRDNLTARQSQGILKLMEE